MTELHTDKQQVDALVARFFSAFTVEHARRDQLQGLRELFIAEALIVCTTGAPQVCSLEQFIAPRVRLLADGALADFREWELSERTEIVGDIAVRSCTYAKSGVLRGLPFQGRGVKLLQFLRTSEGWRLSSLSWQDEPST